MASWCHPNISNGAGRNRTEQNSVGKEGSHCRGVLVSVTNMSRKSNPRKRFRFVVIHPLLLSQLNIILLLKRAILTSPPIPQSTSLKFKHHSPSSLSDFLTAEWPSIRAHMHAVNIGDFDDMIETGCRRGKNRSYGQARGRGCFPGRKFNMGELAAVLATLIKVGG